jgi:hypothetical protein
MTKFANAMIVSYDEVVYYVYNDKKIDIEDFISIEMKGFTRAFEKHVVLFDRYDTKTYNADGHDRIKTWMVSVN